MRKLREQVQMRSDQLHAAFMRLSSVEVECDAALAELERLLVVKEAEALRRSPERMGVLMDAINDGALAQAEAERDGLAAALRAACGQFAAGGVGGGISAEECNLKAERYHAALAKYAPEPKPEGP